MNPAAITETIRSRFSCRKYSSQPIPPQVRDDLEHFLDGVPPGPFGNSPRLDLLTATQAERSALKSLGTYGFIQNPTAFIVGAVIPAEKDLEDFGYVMEKAILHATALGLGTCWLGGTFTRSTFADKISLRTDEVIPAVAAAGLIENPEQARRGLLRQFARGNWRLPREKLFFADHFNSSLPVPAAGAFEPALEMVRIAPSASNQQPWRILHSGNSFHFYLRRTPGYREGFFQTILHVMDMQRIDMGIAMCHFELTARELHLPGDWQQADPGIAAPDELTEYVVSWCLNC